MITVAAVLLAAVLVTPTDSFVLMQDGKCITNGAPTNNKAVKARFEGDFFWFTRGGEEYIVRDEATIRTVRKMHDPIFDSISNTLGYTGEQFRIFQRQMEVLREQARVGFDDPALKAEQTRLGLRQNELAQRVNRAVRNAPPEKINAEISRSLATLANDLIERGVARRVR